MPTAPTKLQRWLDLIAFLAARRFPVSTEQLWAGVPAYEKGLEGSDRDKAAVRRMFERDKADLRELGIPVETVPFHVGDEEESFGYRLDRADFHLPYLKLVEQAKAAEDANATEGVANPPGARAPTRAASASPPGAFELVREEAGAALDGLRELSALPAFPLAGDARSAFRKLAFDLDPDVVAEAPLVHVEDPEAAATAPLLGPLSDALLARKAVAFDYHAMGRDDQARRTVWPYGLVFQHGRWYLVGRDPDKAGGAAGAAPDPGGDARDAADDGVRMFRVGRMGDLEVNATRPGTPDYEIPAGFDLAAYGGRKAWELGEDDDGAVEATVRFAYPRSFWAERNGHGTLVEEHADGSHLRRFTLRRRDPFLRWILSLGGDARIVEPEALRREFQAMVGRVAAHYGGAAADPTDPTDAAPEPSPAPNDHPTPDEDPGDA